MSLSVIIPTYNRADFLRDTLASLSHQSLPVGEFEVIVVDDGSNDDTRLVVQESYPFLLRYVHQANQGDAAARNLGVSHSSADLLVFLDDDILVEADYLLCMVQAHSGDERRIVVGTERIWLSPEAPPLREPILDEEQCRVPLEPLPFADVCSNNMSIPRRAYLEIGPMDNLDFPGSSIWCDVDFAYRASQLDFAFYRSSQALCWHRDYVSTNLENRKKRMWETAYRAATLFEKHPALRDHLPMFEDKTAVAWRSDPPRLIARKLARRVASSAAILSLFEAGLRLAEGLPALRGLRTPLERWIVGGQIYRGLQAGLRARPRPASNRRPLEI